MTDGPYRVGGHSPVNVWLDPQRGEKTGVQVCMATSPEWAKEIVHALNAQATAPPEPVVVDSELPDRQLRDGRFIDRLRNERVALWRERTQLQDEITAAHALLLELGADMEWKNPPSLADRIHLLRLDLQANQLNFDEIQRQLAEMIDADEETGFPALLEQVRAELERQRKAITLPHHAETETLQHGTCADGTCEHYPEECPWQPYEVCVECTAQARAVGGPEAPVVMAADCGRVVQDAPTGGQTRDTGTP